MQEPPIVIIMYVIIIIKDYYYTFYLLFIPFVQPLIEFQSVVAEPGTRLSSLFMSPNLSHVAIKSPLELIHILRQHNSVRQTVPVINHSECEAVPTNLQPTPAFIHLQRIFSTPPLISL